MKQITETSFQQGYFKIPRTLLKQQTGSGQLENMGAFFQVLSHANYSETTYNIHGLTIFCQRGESLISNLHWSILFGWTRYKTARFFKRLEREGIIEILPHPEKTFHIRIINYDLWTGSAQPADSSQKEEESSKAFHTFWDNYHQIMRKPKVNVARARHEWEKLTKEEWQLAIDRIEVGYYHTNDTRFIAHASTYLKDKAFLNEYID